MPVLHAEPKILPSQTTQLSKPETFASALDAIFAPYSKIASPRAKPILTVIPEEKESKTAEVQNKVADSEWEGAFKDLEGIAKDFAGEGVHIVLEKMEQAPPQTSTCSSVPVRPSTSPSELEPEEEPEEEPEVVLAEPDIVPVAIESPCATFEPKLVKPDCVCTLGYI